MEQLRPIAETHFNCFNAGEGPVLLFVHCSSANHKQWRFLLEDYRHKFQVVAPDLLSYGGTPAWQSSDNPYSVTDLDLVESLLPGDRPYHIIAHSYGGALALEVARRAFLRAANPPQSLFLIEPVAAHLVHGHNNRAWQEFVRVSQACIGAVERGQHRRAAAIYMGYWIGHLRWLLAPRKYKQRILATMHKVAYEFKTLTRLTQEDADHSIVSCPLTLIIGARSPHSMRAVAASLLSQAPKGRQLWIKGAGHMSPFTHPQAIRQELRAHFQWADQLPAGTTGVGLPPPEPPTCSHSSVCAGDRHNPTSQQ